MSMINIRYKKYTSRKQRERVWISAFMHELGRSNPNHHIKRVIELDFYSNNRRTRNR